MTDRDRTNIAQISALISPSDWAWTESFYPTVDGKQPAEFNIPIDRAGELIRKYVRPREHIRRKASDLFEDRLQGHHLIGVHVRGTDGHSAPMRGIEIPFDRYFARIEEELSTIGRESCRVFLATDEQYVVELFEDRFGDVLVYYDAVRSLEGDDVMGAGPTGQGVPGYITKGADVALKNGEDAVVEYTLLCMCQVFVHNQSSLSAAVRASVADSVRV